MAEKPEYTELTSPWTESVLSQLDTVLSNGTDFETTVRWLRSQNTSIPQELCALAVVSALENYWHAIRVGMATRIANEGTEWKSVAEVTGYTSRRAAYNFFHREAGTLKGYNPTRRHSKKPKKLVPRKPRTSAKEQTQITQ